MSNVTITVTTREGRAVYVPPTRNREHRWVFLRPRKDGTEKRTPMPERLRRLSRGRA